MDSIGLLNWGFSRRRVSKDYPPVCHILVFGLNTDWKTR